MFKKRMLHKYYRLFTINKFVYLPSKLSNMRTWPICGKTVACCRVLSNTYRLMFVLYKQMESEHDRNRCSSDDNRIYVDKILLNLIFFFLISTVASVTSLWIEPWNPVQHSTVTNVERQLNDVDDRSRRYHMGSGFHQGESLFHHNFDDLQSFDFDILLVPFVHAHTCSAMDQSTSAKKDKMCRSLHISISPSRDLLDYQPSLVFECVWKTYASCPHGVANLAKEA